MKLSPPMKNESDFLAKKNSDIFAYSLNISEEISYGDIVFLLEVRLSTSRCIIVTFDSTFPSMNPKILCSSFSFISDFFPSYALRLASNGESP